jgi:hypothetical protein
MHWTIIVLCLFTILCGVANAAHWALTRTVRTVGILVCLGWTVQQSYWWATGYDSIILFAVCDAAIIAWFLTRKRRFDIAEKLIAATIPLTTALGAYAWLHGGHTMESWWANWAIVAGQMAAGLPFVPEAGRRIAAVNRQFNPWDHFDLRARHEDAT